MFSTGATSTRARFRLIGSNENAFKRLIAAVRLFLGKQAWWSKL